MRLFALPSALAILCNFGLGCAAPADSADSSLSAESVGAKSLDEVVGARVVAYMRCGEKQAGQLTCLAAANDVAMADLEPLRAASVSSVAGLGFDTETTMPDRLATLRKAFSAMLCPSTVAECPLEVEQALDVDGPSLVSLVSRDRDMEVRTFSSLNSGLQNLAAITLRLAVDVKAGKVPIAPSGTNACLTGIADPAAPTASQLDAATACAYRELAAHATEWGIAAGEASRAASNLEVATRAMCEGVVTPVDAPSDQKKLAASYCTLRSTATAYANLAYGVAVTLAERR